MSTVAERLERIAKAHHKYITVRGAQTDYCLECANFWPCPSYVWATTDRDVNAPWDPDEDVQLDRPMLTDGDDEVVPSVR
jgi:hypothetical protein